MGCRRVLSRDPVESSGFCTGKDEFYVLTSPLVHVISHAYILVLVHYMRNTTGVVLLLWLLYRRNVPRD